jgi:hypothetical protein
MSRIGLVCASALAIWVLAFSTGVGSAARPVFRDHINGTSDPYADNLCGVDVTAVTRIVEDYRLDENGVGIDNVNVTTVFTSSSGQSVEFHQAGVGKADALVDNGDGTLTFIQQQSGSSPQIKIPNGPVIGVTSGTATVAITIDAETGHFLSFVVLRESRPAGAGECPAIVEALS